MEFKEVCICPSCGSEIKGAKNELYVCQSCGRALCEKEDDEVSEEKNDIDDWYLRKVYPEEQKWFWMKLKANHPLAYEMTQWIILALYLAALIINIMRITT